MGNYGDVSGYNNSYGDYGCCNRNNGSAFALIVVLFILLIIVGASFMHKSY